MNHELKVAVVCKKASLRTNFINQFVAKKIDVITHNISLRIRNSIETYISYNDILLKNYSISLLDSNNNKNQNIVLNTAFLRPELSGLCFINVADLEQCKSADLIIFLTASGKNNLKLFNKVLKLNIKTILCYTDFMTTNVFQSKDFDLAFDVSVNYNALELFLKNELETFKKEIAEKNRLYIKKKLYNIRPPRFSMTQPFLIRKYVAVMLFMIIFMINLVQCIKIPSIIPGEIGLLCILLCLYPKKIYDFMRFTQFILDFAKLEGYEVIDKESYSEYYKEKKIYNNQSIYRKDGKLRYKGSIKNGQTYGKGIYYNRKGDIVFYLDKSTYDVKFEYYKNNKLICNEKTYFAENWEIGYHTSINIKEC